MTEIVGVIFGVSLIIAFCLGFFAGARWAERKVISYMDEMGFPKP